MNSTITNAGYGVWNSTIDVTQQVQRQYASGTRVFLARNQYGDPAPNQRKYLYIFWTTGNGGNQSGVTGENDNHGITIP
ncbi:hypothetical protein NCW_01143 [Burkholderia pseudomallei]|uniref:hypothetical protein n=1 Tax=Burkholderia pseudomallei TaxID=28450 RepID=UPI0005313503|nr:hypothetical protein [Burkholderia pseudomallei]KGT00490.1 hypothetical protein JT30_1079 [Burkholderia pseudomallei]KGU73129.1 hypothetical protein X883_2701 [Burkholderia pseudomallei MSHR4304]KGV33387.1 hypothetical protein X884_3102 [Burkholderia pseudomallei MSHR4308]